MTSANEDVPTPAAGGENPAFHPDIISQQFQWYGLPPGVLHHPRVQHALDLNRQGFLAEDRPHYQMAAKSFLVVRPVLDDPFFENGAGIDYRPVPLRQVSDPTLKLEQDDASPDQIEAYVSVANRRNNTAKTYGTIAAGLGLAAGFGAYGVKKQFDKVATPPSAEVLAEQTAQAKVNCDLTVAQDAVPALQAQVYKARNGEAIAFNRTAEQSRQAHEICVPKEVEAIQGQAADAQHMTVAAAGVGVAVLLAGAFFAAKKAYGESREKHEYQGIAGTKIVNGISVEAEANDRFRAKARSASVAASEPA